MVGEQRDMYEAMLAGGPELGDDSGGTGAFRVVWQAGDIPELIKASAS
ncbi:hypothetical protein GCM10009608_33410 [Pseudonocardia alaniniphila]